MKNEYFLVCIKCRESFCKAGCYYKNKGFDYGYCENGACKCVQPEIYYFDGKDHNVDKYSVNYNFFFFYI